ncbi:MAG: hypothetical protein LC808_11885, partial [Actinobacteria bacterium]|nr:hypothetical protein [Actinomycetota bacterium]
ANMFLGPLDDVLRAYSAVRSKLTSALLPQGRVARWMDDVWVFGADAGKMRAAQLDIQDALRSSGLELNHAKTDVLEGPRVDEEAKKVQHSAVDNALTVTPGEPQDVAPLMELVEKLLNDPSNADRTSVKFVTTRMRDHSLYGAVPDFAENAERMPHVADSLARLFRDSIHWRDMQRWYVEYATSPWG